MGRLGLKDGERLANSAAFQRSLERRGISEGSLRQYAGEYPTNTVRLPSLHSAPSFVLSKAPDRKPSQEIEPRETIDCGCFSRIAAFLCIEHLEMASNLSGLSLSCLSFL